MKLDDYRLLTIGALVRYPSLRKEYAQKLKEDMFEDPAQQFLVGKLKKTETVTDLIEQSQQIGGLSYLRQFYKAITDFGTKITPREITRWIEFLDQSAKRRAVERYIDQTREELDKLAFDANHDKLVASLVSHLVDSKADKYSQGFRHIESAADELIGDMFDLGRGIVRDRTSTGFEQLDEFLGGGLPHGLNVISGLPGVGKTSLTLEWLANDAQARRRRVIKSKGKQSSGVDCAVSAEMSLKSLLKRLAQSRTSVEIRKNMPESDIQKVVRYINHARSLPIMVDDSDMLNTRTIFQRLESIYLTHGEIGEIMIDFAERILDDNSSDNMEQRVGQVFIRASILGRRYNCATNLIAHLNRDSENSRTKVPSMSDLRYSRLAEATAELVGLIYNPYHYTLTGKPIPTPASMPATPGTAYFIVDKHRDGMTGVKPLSWEAQFTKWGDSPKEGIYHKISSKEVLLD